MTAYETKQSADLFYHAGRLARRIETETWAGFLRRWDSRLFLDSGGRHQVSNPYPVGSRFARSWQEGYARESMITVSQQHSVPDVDMVRFDETGEIRVLKQEGRA